MNNEDLIINYMQNNLKLKVSIFDDNEGESDKTAEVIKQIALTRDYDFILFSNFYFFLFNQRILNATDDRHAIASNDVWLIINSSRTIILNYIKNKDKTHYQNMTKYLLTTFKKDVEKYKSELGKELRSLKSKLSPEKRLMLESLYKNEVLRHSDDHKFGIKFNTLASTLMVINALKENINEAKLLVEDEKRYKFNFWLSLSLAIFSIVLGIASIIISLI